MKRFLRSDAVQAILGWVLGVYLRLMLETVRWTHENAECVEPVLNGEQGALGLFWHGRLPLSLATARHWWRKRTKALVSPSADGEFVARAVAMSGFPSIRVSSAKKGDTKKARQAIVAIREAVTWAAGGGCIVISPDGPRGPNEVIAPGTLYIARHAGVPVFLTGIACKPSWRVESSWDRAMFGLPFGRGAVVWEGPLYVPKDADDATIAHLIEDWSARLTAVNRRAEVLCGLVSEP